MSATEEERWLAALRDHAAHLVFPEWAPQAGDWTHLYTGFVDDGTPYTEVAVYRAGDGGGHVRICYRRFAGEDLTAFWTRLIDEVTE
ncbi:hypothetical protein FAF44_40165 [Nonomuraea sp. MG754425]|uniref:hypothetical protein n=1 Tax=Nonomuraea sp. MG754425 TaxID=2570319 RepID=UPI001F3A231C|nr:hypothetical protein [Nonomuraea sp. MG754425]MCF6474555.1 hypothetical protein [Nonomuraea sp. MG754425]